MLTGCKDYLAFEYACDMEDIEEKCVRARRTKAETKRVEAFTVEEQRAIEREIVSPIIERKKRYILSLFYRNL